jgi:hypothetical protein
MEVSAKGGTNWGGERREGAEAEGGEQLRGGGEQLRGGGGEKLRWSATKGNLAQPRRGDAWETMGAAVSARLISGIVSFVDYA